MRALFSFDISGVIEITRFISRKQVRTVAQPLNISLVQPAPVSAEFREQMIARLNNCSFVRACMRAVRWRRPQPDLSVCPGSP